MTCWSSTRVTNPTFKSAGSTGSSPRHSGTQSHHRRDRLRPGGRETHRTPPESEIIAQRGYELFHVVVQAPVSLAYSQEKGW
ncbi:hypothetical protein BDM02DRAFT_3122551, partial [Thelephora ganbajun]